MTTSGNRFATIQTLLTQYTFIIIFIVGNFSNLANILVFLQKTLRSNACSWYFALISLGHLLFLYFGLFTRLMSTWLGFDLTRTSIIYCQIRIYFLTLSLLMARYFLCLISIDRWMITSRQNAIRQLSSLKIARWFMLVGVGFCMIFSSHFPIWYRIEGNRGCVGASNTFYPLFFMIYNLVITIGPFFVMILFSALVLKNLREGRHRQVASTFNTQATITSMNPARQSRRRDVQFIKLSLMQTLIYIVCNTFYAYNATYAFITQSIVKSAERAALDSFLSTIGLIISYSYTAVSHSWIDYIQEDEFASLDYLLFVHGSVKYIP